MSTTPPAPLTAAQMETMRPFKLLEYLADATPEGVMADMIPQEFFRVRLAQCVHAIPGDTVSLRDHVSLDFLRIIQRDGPDPAKYTAVFAGADAAWAVP